MGESNIRTSAAAPARRKFLSTSARLASAGWIAGLGGSWLLRPAWGQTAKVIRMGIASDVTGPYAASGNSMWQAAQFTADSINAEGGIAGRLIELVLEDTGSDPKTAVTNVRRLIQQHKVDVVIGGFTSATRQAIKDPIVTRGRTLYIYPHLYEGKECTPNLFCTGPTPAQQLDALIPYLVKTLGRKRFAFPSANYVWPQTINKYARRLIEANGASVVFEEYYPLDQAEYSATIQKIRDGGVDCVFNTIIPPGLQPFMKQLYESGFQERGGLVSCPFYDESLLNYHPAHEMEGLVSCLDFYQSVNDPSTRDLLAAYARRFPNTKYPFTAGSGCGGMYRGIKLYQAAVTATHGDVSRDAVAAALDSAKIATGPGGGAEMVLGKRHCRLNMYIGQCRTEGGQAHYEVLSKSNMMDPKEC